MKNFLIYTLATITGIILASIIFFLIMIGSLSAMVAAGDKKVSISENSILVLKTNVQIPDRSDPNPFAGLDILNMTITPATGLNDIPVSYTHLRAHETVLDLVCRLLLEKKKKN